MHASETPLDRPEQTASDSHSSRPAGDAMGSSQRLPGGKLPAQLLAQLLADLPTDDPRLLLGPQVGEDAAVLDLGGDRLLVAKSDPITFATDEIGYYAVNVCTNDLAVTGAEPRFYLPTILLPAGQADAGMARRLFGQLGDACRRLSITIAGGHSEITPAVSQPVIAGTLLGEVARDRFVRSGGCRPGHLLLMAGSAPVEGVSLIAREKRTDLQAQGWSEAELDAAANYLYEPGISVLAPALAAAQTGRVTAMHDPTEGGIATGLLELALAADVGLEVTLEAIPVPKVARRLCAAFDLDPLGVIASGALLATAAPQDADTILGRWRELGWRGSVIGRILPKENGIYARQEGQQVALPRFAADEVTKLWR